MYSERMQILISPDQRRRLESEAQRTGASMASLVRDAVDARFDSPTREERIEAARRTASRSAELPSPEELKELIASRFDDEIDPDLMRGE